MMYYALRHFMDHPELHHVAPDPHYIATVQGDIDRIQHLVNEQRELLRDQPRHHGIDFGEDVWTYENTVKRG